MIVRPQPGGDVTWAYATLYSLYGTIDVKWKIAAQVFTLDLVTPPNTTATITLPTCGEVYEGGQPLQLTSPGIMAVAQGDRTCSITVAAGAYRFEAPYAPIPSLPSPPPNPHYRAPHFSIHTSVSSIYADEAARTAVLAALPDAASALAALLEQNRRRPYSLDQLAILAPAVLTPENLIRIDQQLARL